MANTRSRGETCPARNPVPKVHHIIIGPDDEVRHMVSYPQCTKERPHDLPHQDYHGELWTDSGLDRTLGQRRSWPAGLTERKE